MYVYIRYLWDVYV